MSNTVSKNETDAITRSPKAVRRTPIFTSVGVRIRRLNRLGMTDCYINVLPIHLSDSPSMYQEITYADELGIAVSNGLANIVLAHATKEHTR